jgi:hypothetical protein
VDEPSASEPPAPQTTPPDTTPSIVTEAQIHTDTTDVSDAKEKPDDSMDGHNPDEEK